MHIINFWCAGAGLGVLAFLRNPVGGLTGLKANRISSMMKNLIVRHKKWMLAVAVVLLVVICIDCGSSVAQEPLARHSATTQVDELLHRFAEGGKFKMLYDARQRPQGILVNDFVFIVYNGDARPSSNGKGRAYPMLICYNRTKKKFNSPIRLANESSTDHHDSPIIWADRDGHLHVLYGCHRSPGVHLVTAEPVGNDAVEIRWVKGAQIAPRMSYPCVFRMTDGKDLIYYRTDGHTSSWTYRMTADNGRSWSGPENDVTDLDAGGRLDWSSYQTKIPSLDRKSLHVVYTDYDDNKNHFDEQRFFNPKYRTFVSNEWKYNLSYIRIEAESGRVFNGQGRVMETPIDIDTSEQSCEIWDTNWRGAGVPPAVALNEQGAPVFLHVLSGDSLEQHDYYYVRKTGRDWKKTRITSSTHQWNSGHLACDEHGILHAYVVTGAKYLQGGYMDRHGGGVIEEWRSKDSGEQWEKVRQVSPMGPGYGSWRFNNVQPVLNADGSIAKGILLFYGWNEKDEPNASAFLIDRTQ